MKNIAMLLAVWALLAGATTAEAQNLLENGNFSQDIEMSGGRWNPRHWVASQRFELPFDTFYSVVDWVSPGEPWQWNASYPVALEGTEYRFSFSARVATGTGKISAGWGMNQAPWSADVKEYELSTSWRTFEFVGVPSFGAFQNARVLFDYGQQTQAVFIDDVVLEKTNNLLSNGGFQQGLSGWIMTGAHRIENQAYVGSVASAGEPWQANVSHPVRLESGATYRLRFRARTSAGGFHTVVAGWGRNQAPWEDVSTKVFPLDEQWKSFEYVATVPYAQASNSRVLFDYGDKVGEVFLDDVTLEKIAQVSTSDGLYIMGPQADGSVLELVTERVYNGYLQPSSSTRPSRQWIATRPEAHTMGGPLLRKGIEHVGTYVQECNTLSWVNVNQTELNQGTWASVSGQNPTRYEVRLSMVNAVVNEPQLQGNFVCDRSQGGMLEVFYRDVYTLFPADGVTTVGYVIRHTP